jgi:RNA polymerase sigma-70 factor (ECF subfamily)
MSNLVKEFGKIYDKHVDKIYRFVYFKVNSTEIAEDLTSEVFLRGWQSFKEKGSKIENVTAFLYQIARNLVTDHYREKAQAVLVSTDNAPVIPDLGINLEQKAMINSDIDRIKAVLTNIKDEYREIIIWYYMDEFTVPEIAKILNKSEDTVRVTIHRALKALKSELGEV